MVPRQQPTPLAKYQPAIQFLRRYANYVFLVANVAILALVFVRISLAVVVNIVAINIWLYLLVWATRFGWMLLNSQGTFAQMKASNKKAMTELAAIEAEVEAWRRNCEIDPEQLLEE